ncbi:MAG: S41 family peptidase [Bacteroidota bacterium]
MPPENNHTFLSLSQKLISVLTQKLYAKPAKLLFKLLLLLTLVLFYIIAPAQIANTISPADKVFGLSKFWQEVNYNYVYFNKINHQTWDSTYKALISQVQASQNDYEYYRLMAKFCALLKDGHTEVIRPAIRGLNFMNNTFGDYLLVLTRVDDKVIVKRTWKKDEQKFPLGSEIIEVNGLSTTQYIQDSIAPYISSSTDYVRNDIASRGLLTGAPGSTFTVKLRKPDGAEVIYSLTHGKAKDSVFLPDPGVYLDEQPRKALESKVLPGNIAYVALNTFAIESKTDSLFENLLPLLENAKGIVIDLRYNGGGDDGVAFNILRHFIKDSLIQGSSSVTRSYDPYLKAIGKDVALRDTVGNKDKREAWLLYNGYAVYGEPGTWHLKIAKNVKRLGAPVVILTSHNTYSAAEDFLIGVDNQKHIVKVGEPTGGSSGKPYTFGLPGGGYARVCIKKDAYPDGREFVGYGIQPDIRVTPTVKDYLESRDVVLEAALKYFETKIYMQKF